MKDALDLNSIEALLTLLPYDHRINKFGKIFNIRPEPYIFFLDHERIKFRPRKKTFSIANAWWLSEMAFLAYEDGRTVELLLKNLGFEGKFFNSLIWDGEAFIAYDDKKIFLVYRGTEPTKIRDWVTDMRFNKIKTSKENTIHSGFKNHFDELEKDFRIGSMLSILLNGNRKLYIAGHSLGGALAVYAAHYYMHNVPVVKPKELSVYTFGAPKIGDEAFSNSFDKINAFRIVHRNDMIPRLPPVGKFLPVGQLKFLDTNGDLKSLKDLPDVHLENGRSKVKLTIKSLKTLGWNKWKQYASVMMDHSPVYYSILLKEEALKELAESEKKKIKKQK